MVVHATPEVNTDLGSIHRPCPEFHPGLCTTDDFLIFAPAMKLAKSIHGELKSVPDGTFVGFYTIRYAVEFCVGIKRFNNPQLIIFGQCAFSGDEHTGNIDLMVRNGEFVFHTSFSIARRGGEGPRGAWAFRLTWGC